MKQQVGVTDNGWAAALQEGILYRHVGFIIALFFHKVPFHR